MNRVLVYVLYMYNKLVFMIFFVGGKSDSFWKLDFVEKKKIDFLVYKYII